MTDIAEIRAAAARMEGVAVRTPLLEAPLLNRLAGRRVLVKAEALQRTGSFKFRGAWSHLSTLNAETRRRGVLAYSSGNHAQGVALAAQQLETPATIVMPADAPALKLANTRAYGAEVVLYDRAGGASREALGSELTEQRGLHLVKPYDDPLVIAGQGVIGLEIAEQARAAGIESADVLVCCGGGGLTSGIALALEAEAPALRTRPVEPVGFDDWGRSLASGHRESNTALTGSICDAILTPEPGELTFPIGQRLFGTPLTVSDEEAKAAMAAAAQYLKLVLEPGGAVGLAAALSRSDQLSGDAVIVVASGGNIDLTTFAAILASQSH
ncbi:MAG: threonine/serine dehydratase [Rhodobacteraceae bacterium]|nr:threonine/serine dehydratase [Paracoccaceae bacterium]